MDTNAIIEQLRAHPFFSGFQPRHLKCVADCASDIHFEEGEYIYREGQEAKEFYVLLAGLVSVEILWPGESGIPLQKLGPGEVLGWSWAAPPRKKRFDAKTLEPTHAIRIDADALRARCREDLELSHELLKRTIEVIGQRLQATRLRLRDAYGASAASQKKRS
ncbi:MAG TPA: cyclic nucleotide-binding domain-containing protein [bacterium]